MRKVIDKESKGKFKSLLLTIHQSIYVEKLWENGKQKTLVNKELYVIPAKAGIQPFSMIKDRLLSLSKLVPHKLSHSTKRLDNTMIQS